MKENIGNWVCVAYLMVFLACFGHFATRGEYCRTTPYVGQCYLASLTVGVFWPFYLSIKLWEQP